MIAAIYARKSTEQNVSDEEKSVTRQVEHARAFAAAKGWTVAEKHVYADDGISGAEFVKRPGFLRLMNALKPRAPFEILIMSEGSRLGREQIEPAYALKQLVQAGVRVFFYLEDRERTLDSPTDKVMLSLTAFADELEREKARQRTTDAMLRKARAGHVTGGVVFGYDNVEVRTPEGQRILVDRRVNDLEAAVVRRIFNRCADGAGLRTIAHELNADRAPAPLPRRRERPRGWAPSSVREILHRQLYRGVLLYNRTRKRDQWGRKRQQQRDAGEVIRLDMPELRIVAEDLWQRVHERLDGMRAQYARTTGGKQLAGRPASGVESRFLLTGFAVCGVCGGTLCARSRSHGRSRVYFYGCTTFERKGPSVCGNALALPMVATDQALLEALKEELLDPAVIARTIVKAVAELQRDDTGTSARGEVLRRELATLENQLGRLAEAIVLGGDSPTEARRGNASS
jgi:DNA invertase Pin-like site-specific DNA recombinase